MQTQRAFQAAMHYNIEAITCISNLRCPASGCCLNILILSDTTNPKTLMGERG